MLKSCMMLCFYSNQLLTTVSSMVWRTYMCQCEKNKTKHMGNFLFLSIFFYYILLSCKFCIHRNQESRVPHLFGNFFFFFLESYSQQALEWLFSDTGPFFFFFNVFIRQFENPVCLQKKPICILWVLSLLTWPMIDRLQIMWLLVTSYSHFICQVEITYLFL